MNTTDSSLRSLVLNVDIGAGHRRAAEALCDALVQLHPATRYQIVEAMDYLGPGVKDLARDLYLGIQKEIPDLWGFLYEQRGVFQWLAPLAELVDEVRAEGIRPLLRSFPPDLLIATHPIAVGLAGGLRRNHWVRCPLVVLITDFDWHPSWVVRGVDLYIVPGEMVARGLQEQGVDPRRIAASGIPLRSAFATIRPSAPLHQQWGLDPQRLTILLLGGGLGLGPVLETAELLSQLAEEPLQLVLIAGNNQDLAKEARQLAQRSVLPLHVTGLVENIDEYMRVAALAVGKPGGLTAAELMAVGVPLVALQPLAGQEEANYRALQHYGVAQRADTPRQAVAVIRRLLREKEERLQMQQKAMALGRPQAAATAAKRVLDLCRGENH